MLRNKKILSSFFLLLILVGAIFFQQGINLQSTKYPDKKVQALTDDNETSLGVSGQRARVTKVIDGDTLVIDNGQKVRLIGVDTPETVDPRRPIGCFGKEASDFSKQLLEGKEIVLSKDVSEIDKFGRLLRYVYLPNTNGTIFVNDLLVQEGYATVATYPPDVKFSEKLLNSQQNAKDLDKGLWSKCKR